MWLPKWIISVECSLVILIQHKLLLYHCSTFLLVVVLSFCLVSPLRSFRPTFFYFWRKARMGRKEKEWAHAIIIFTVPRWASQRLEDWSAVATMTLTLSLPVAAACNPPPLHPTVPFALYSGVHTRSPSFEWKGIGTIWHVGLAFMDLSGRYR